MSHTILITGANRGIGLELTSVFAENNWNVLACCRHPEKAGALHDIAEKHATVSAYALDVTDHDAINRLSQGLDGQAIDILFNNAGLFGPEKQEFGNTAIETWLEVLRTNVIAPLKIAEAFIKQVATSQRKIIATMGSMMGSVQDNSSGGYYIYRTSKAAVNMITKSLAIDLKNRGVTSVVFHPGWVQTDMGGPQAPTTARESATGLYRVLTHLTADDNGRFLTFEGNELPW